MIHIRSTLRLAAVCCTLLLLGAAYGVASSAADTSSHASPRHAGTPSAGDLPFAVNAQAGTLQIADATISHGTFVSAAGERLTINAAILGASPAKRTLRIPRDARIVRNGTTVALADLRAGDEVIVVQGPYGTYLSARDAQHAATNHDPSDIDPFAPDWF